MRVIVERCFDSKLHYRLTLPNGDRYLLYNHDEWNRAAAIEAKDLITANYKVKRNSIRFV